MFYIASDFAGEPKISDRMVTELSRYVADGNEVVDFKLSEFKVGKILKLVSYVSS